MITIGVCGYGYTGSGAVYDLLREFDQCSAVNTDLDFEFMLPYIQHGLQDLEFQIMRSSRFFSTDAAIKDFIRLVKMLDIPFGLYRRLYGKQFKNISNNFISEITELSWSGTTIEDKYIATEPYRSMRFRLFERLIYLYESKTEKRFPPVFREVVYLSVSHEAFLEAACKYIRSLLLALRLDFDKNILLNQPFDINNPECSMKFFENPKAILVDRDPRDIYILAKVYLGKKGDFICTDTVDRFIQYHKLIRRRNYNVCNSNVLNIRFEDLIYNYEKTVDTIASFLCLDRSKYKKGLYFDPNVSVENTQLYLRHTEFANDIERIEAELADFLYPFSEQRLIPSHSLTPF